MRDPRELSPVRLTGGGAMLLLVDSTGAEYAVPVDGRLRDTLGHTVGTSTGGPQTGTGAPATEGRDPQKEPSMSIALRPKEIQDRVRAGESAEDLAAAAGSSLDRVLAYAGPVLAERAHVARTALDASVRRTGDAGTGGSARGMGDAAEERLREAGADPETLDWDAWRREDGRWALQATYRCDGEARNARFVFDQRGRFVTPADDEASWLVGDAPVSRHVPEPLTPAAQTSSDETTPAMPRRLRLAPLPEIPETGAALSAPVAEPEETLRDDEGQLDLLLDAPRGGTDESGTDAAEVDAQDREDTAGLARRHPRKQRGRASVPSWDEIMFGGRD